MLVEKTKIKFSEWKIIINKLDTILKVKWLKVGLKEQDKILR